MASPKRERRQRETITALRPPEAEPAFSEIEEAFFRAGEQLAEEAPQSSDNFEL